MRSYVEIRESSQGPRPNVTLTGVSDNVGGVKRFLSTHLYTLKEERHFALVDGVAFPTVGSIVICFQVRNSVRPMHLFDPQLRS